MILNVGNVFQRFLNSFVNDWRVALANNTHYPSINEKVIALLNGHVRTYDCTRNNLQGLILAG